MQREIAQVDRSGNKRKGGEDGNRVGDGVGSGSEGMSKISKVEDSSSSSDEGGSNNVVVDVEEEEVTLEVPPPREEETMEEVLPLPEKKVVVATSFNSLSIASKDLSPIVSKGLDVILPS